MLCFLEARSARILKVPLKWSTATRLDSQACKRVANTRRMLPAIMEVELRSLCVQATADMLSHQIAGLWCLRFDMPTAISNVSHCITIPSSSKSDIVIGPVGFVGVQRSCFTFGGHLRNQTKGNSSLVHPNQTPRQPQPYTSTRPLYALVVCIMSSFTCDGRLRISFSIAPQFLE